MQNDIFSQRLEQLRHLMREYQVDFWLAPSADAHQSEYVPEAWQRRLWISNFSGSAGDALIGLEQAWLWTDSRYWLQAETELSAGHFQLMRQGDADTPSLPAFLRTHAAKRRIGYDAALHSPAEAESLRTAAAEAGAELISLPNLIDAVWTDAPALPADPIQVWPESYSGRAVSDKLADLRQGLRDQGADHLVIATLDELAWAFDIRARDVHCTPHVIGWGLVSLDGAILFVAPGRQSPELDAHLDAAGVKVLSYADFYDHLGTLEGTLLIDPDHANQKILDALGPKGAPKIATSPLLRLRAMKNAQEVHGMRQAHLRDGVAVVRFLASLERDWRGLDEVSLAARLEAYRQDEALFQGPSFDTIAGYADHGAIVHYRALPESAHAIGDEALLLIDSGAQYLDGTTDITRTLHLGTPTEDEKANYTRVLQGHLALSRLAFPHGTTGTHVDAFARAPLWEHGLNYGHGTGHGVGAYLSVHQGPQRISPALNDVALELGMVVSNEPGFYLDGEYGIRVENLVVVVPREDLTGPFGTFYAFDDLTLVPHARNLIDTALLSDAEIAQIDAYHARVYAEIAPRLEGYPDADAALSWLKEATAPLIA